jgi:MFS family permease
MQPLRTKAWLVAAALLAILTVSSGLGFYNLSVYMKLLAAERDFPLTAVSLAVGMFFLIGAPAGLLVGAALQRFPPRLIIIVGALLGGVALIAMPAASNLGGLLVVYAVFGVGNTCVSIIPATTLITRWFDATRRPLALSVTSTGLSLGGVLLTPLSALLLERWELAHALPFLGALYAGLIAPVAWLFVSLPPHDAGSAGTPTLAGHRFGDAVRSRFFVLLSAGYLLVLGTQVGGIAHLFSRGAEIATPLDASLAVSVLASMSVVGRLLGGVLLARVSMRGFTLANIVGQATGFALLAHAGDAAELWLGAAVFGVTVGNLLMLQPLLLAQAFGVAEYPRIFSLNQGITTLGVAAGPVVLGVLRTMQGYLLGFGTFAVLSLLALLLVTAAGAVPRPEELA